LGEQLLLLFSNLQLGLSYGLSILAILLAHEFGHYLAARYHKADVTLPYFFPFPFSSFGTLGAFIQMKSPPKNKRVLHDIGVAGPLAGLVVAIPILLIGLALSPVSEISLSNFPEGTILQVEGNSIVYLFSKYLVHGELLPAPQDYGGLSPVLYWIRYVFTGHPAPLGGRDVMLHPMAWAGWAGLLVTALNLIPVGQLDGGHALYVLFGQKARRIFPVIVVGLGLLGLVWPGWWLWVMLLFFFGQRHAEPLDQITELDPRRRAIAIFVLILFFLLFTPIPLTQYGAASGLL
jgi:membrane-associated protease RseP (regulator of RpoE activity)